MGDMTRRFDENGQFRLPGSEGRQVRARLIGAFDSDDTAGIAFDFSATPRSDSQRAAGKLGDWTFGQDSAKNATKDFFLMDASGNVVAKFVSGGGLTLLGLISESAAGALTAGATQTQAGALALTKELNRVTTVTTAGDGVALPAATAGLTIIVINKGANPMAVYPVNGGSDAIDGLSANASVTQMPSSMVIYSCTTAGSWDTEGLATGYSGSLQTLSFTNGITAFATGGQASAVALTSMVNRITVCATAGDSVKLPASAAGMVLVVTHAATSGAGNDVFPATGDAINNLAANLAIRQPPGTTLTFVSDVAGTWNVTIPRPDAKYTTRALSSSTANAGDLTGAKFVTLNNSGATPGTLTTRTGAQMIADGFYQVGDSYILRVVNGQGTGVLTLGAGDGNVTITGTATMAINSFRDFVVTITGAATLTIQSVATGTFS